MKTVLFICSFNSVRSQIAEGLLNTRCPDRYRAFSAGVAPGGLSPHAVAVMDDVGIDISLQKSKKLTVFSTTRFDYIITMCDHVKLAAATSFPSGGTRVHRHFDTPSEVREDKTAILTDFRTLRDDIDAWLTKIFPDCPKQGT
ncbi:MAG: arsenate reductase ArsC [Methanoregula sp.]|jgi:arsenate reductase|uniref:arsenate reductase ArsC n=1 Tax=Methanoregula sp. TaxID=2052170 RepID=UPI0025ED7B16|nr:arsenate reductase ArsC [Methanoregula sp.]MCK9632270.1 arsenate reductase ArsC [Methanoregula sp.]